MRGGRKRGGEGRGERGEGRGERGEAVQSRQRNTGAVLDGTQNSQPVSRPVLYHLSHRDILYECMHVPRTVFAALVCQHEGSLAESSHAVVMVIGDAERVMDTTVVELHLEGRGREN